MYARKLREQLSTISTAMHALVNKAEQDNNRALTSDEQVAFDKMRADYENVESSIKSAEKNATKNGHVDHYEKAFNAYLRNGISDMSPEDRAVLKKGAVTLQNAMSTTTGSQGGYTVPAGFSDQLEAAMKWFGGAEAFSEFETETGNPLPWPTVNDTGNSGRIINQNTQVTNTDVSFGQINFDSYIFSSDICLVPLALLEDSYFDLNALLANLLGTRLGRLKNNKATVGVGTTEPLGIVPAAVAAGSVLTLSTGSATSISFDNLTDLEHKVDPAYRAAGKYMFHDTTFQLLKKLKDSANNRPVWMPYAESGQYAAMPGTINGHQYVVNNDMASVAANAYSVLFGDLSKYKIRKVRGGVSIVVLVERYADYLQRGFMGYARLDGNLLDAGTHPVAVLRNSAT